MPTSADFKIDKKDLLRVIHDELQDLPPLPNVVIEVMQTAADPNASAADLNELICMDTAMSARILRLVNSAHYGFASQVTTIAHAIVILGVESVRNLVSGLGVANTFRPTGRHLLDRKQFWAHSVATALAAGVIAKHRRLSSKISDEVFVGGLLHDIGKLFLDQFFTRQYNIAIQLAVAGKVSMLRAELLALGIDHTIVGAQIADSWHLPVVSTSMIASHHEPQAARGYFECVAAVHAADVVVKELQLGCSGDIVVPEMDPVVARWLGFTAADWVIVRKQIVERFGKAEEFVNVMVG